MTNGDFVAIGTAANIAAEYSAGTGNPADKFVLAHFYDGEPVSVEGFATKEQAIAMLEEYHGCEIERLFIELDQ